MLSGGSFYKNLTRIAAMHSPLGRHMIEQSSGGHIKTSPYMVAFKKRLRTHLNSAWIMFYVITAKLKNQTKLLNATALKDENLKFSTQCNLSDYKCFIQSFSGFFPSWVKAVLSGLCCSSICHVPSCPIFSHKVLGTQYFVFHPCLICYLNKDNGIAIWFKLLHILSPNILKVILFTLLNFSIFLNKT